MGEFYILSLKWSSGEDCYRWWRANASGYTMFLESAGRYSEETVRGNLRYYNNGESTLAVPCDYVEGKANRAVYFDDMRGMRSQALCVCVGVEPDNRPSEDTRCPVHCRKLESLGAGRERAT